MWLECSTCFLCLEWQKYRVGTHQRGKPDVVRSQGCGIFLEGARECEQAEGMRSVEL
jgi:hypothetical protein